MAEQFSKLLRRFLEVAITLWASIVFQGLLWGSGLLFLYRLFLPTIDRAFSQTIATDVPPWLFWATGVGIQVAIRAWLGKPLLRDANREQLDAVEYIVGRLSHGERVQIYRALAKKLCDQFSFEVPTKTSLKEAAEQALAEERADNADVPPER